MVEVKRYMRTDEVADRFGVHAQTLKNWWLTGRTCLVAWHPDHRICGKGLRFTVESVEEFERQGKVTPSGWDEPILGFPRHPQ